MIRHQPPERQFGAPRYGTGALVKGSIEFGVAELRGATVAERGRALAEIAHPDFRAELRGAAASLA